MATIEIKIEVCIGRLLDALTDEADMWPDSKRDHFERDWRAMEKAGAEMAEVRFIGGRLVGYPSEDFTKHCEAWGIHP